MEWQRHDAGEIIIGILWLGKVARNMMLPIFYLAKDVKQEDTHIPLQIFMVQKQLR